jgi:hemerythrin-like domain-containing protein
MGIKIGDAPQSDFSDPLGLLSDCHRRIEHFLGILVAVGRHAFEPVLSKLDSVQPDASTSRKISVPELPADLACRLDDDQRNAIAAALDYFRTASPRHTADEEESLFPRILNSGDERAAAGLAMLENLNRDHEVAEEMHSAVEILFKGWISEDRLSTPDAQTLVVTLDKLSELYRRHIAIEDAEVFPLAGVVLTPAEIAEVGQEMAQRRGIDFDKLKLVAF